LNSDRIKKTLPPYVSYRTFRNFIDGLQSGIPSHIDRSYWGERLSGSNGTQLMTALRFLGLVDTEGTPMTRLLQLIPATGGHRAEILKQIAYSGYDFLVNRSFDPQSATYAHLEKAFYDSYDVTGDVARKCIKFFLEIASDAGVPLSPLIIKKSRTMRAASTKKRAVAIEDTRTKRNSSTIPAMQPIPLWNKWHELVLDKFPAFDPAWPDDVKLKWFEAFDLLLKIDIAPENGKDGKG